MCKGWKNRNASKEESEVIARIIEEFYDPEVTLLSEDELEDIIREYGDDTYKVDEVEEKYFDDGILEEYYDPHCTKLTNEELEEILVEYGDDAYEVDSFKTVGNQRRSGRKRNIRRGGRTKRVSKSEADMRILHMNCDGYTSKKASIENIMSEKQTDVLLLNETCLKGNRNEKTFLLQ